MFQAALNAGLHWAAKTGDEDAAIDRIRALEASASTGYLASRIAGQLINAANNLSRIKLHRAAVAASEAALRLADKVPEGYPKELSARRTLHVGDGQLSRGAIRGRATEGLTLFASEYH